MTHSISHCLRLAVCFALLLPGTTFAQTPLKVIRTATDNLFIRYEENVAADTAVSAMLMAPTADGPSSTRISGQVIDDAHTVRFDLKPGEVSLITASAAAGRHPFVLIDRLVLDNETVTDLVAVVPTDVKFTIEAPVSNTVTLSAVYLTPADASRIALLNRDDWKVEINGTSKDAADVHVDLPNLTPGDGLIYEFLVHLTITGYVANGADAIIKYRADDTAAATQVAKGKTLDAPSKADDDPVGDADLYLGFTYTASRTDETTHVGGLQAHVKRPFYIWGPGNRNVFSVVPAFDARVHAKVLDDEDSMSLKTTFEWERMLGNLDRIPDPNESAGSSLVHDVRTAVGGGLEFSKGFKERNVIAEGLITPAFQAFGKVYGKPRTLEGIKLMVGPSAGFEVGRVLDSGIDALVDSSVKRLKAGITAQLTFDFRDLPYFEALVFEGRYVGRKLYSEEQFASVQKTELAAGPATAADGAVIEIEAGTLVRNIATTVDRKARQYGTLSGKFVFNSNLELFVTYSRGSLPPKFEHVNKFEAGFAIRYNAPY